MVCELSFARPRPWAVFFAAREWQYAEYLRTETPKQRQTRVNRTRKPPTVSAKVFEWDAPEFRRTAVFRDQREDTLERYSSAQKRYDPIANEWDCCYEFGPDDPDSDDE